MVLTLGPELETALQEEAQRRGTDPRNLALDVLKARFLAHGSVITPRDEWERRLLNIAIDCGVSLPDSAFGSDELCE